MRDESRTQIYMDDFERMEVHDHVVFGNNTTEVHTFTRTISGRTHVYMDGLGWMEVYMDDFGW